MKIEACAIEKWYFRGKGDTNRFFAVKQTDLTLEPGKVTVLTGRSGSGKTTLMHMLSGLLTPDGGKVLADGKDLYAQEDKALSGFRNAHFGMIPQGADVLPVLTVMENILLVQGIYANQSRNQGADRSVGVQDRAQKLLGEMGIADLADVPAGELSGGERRRVCVARALAGTPDVIFADEPTSDLDDENMQIVLQMLKKAADEGAAVLIVTHDQEALDYADVCLKMHAGVPGPAAQTEDREAPSCQEGGAGSDLQIV